ncbi:hypothetical protein GCM10017708_01510 [Arthrobacter citreus]
MIGQLAVMGVHPGQQLMGLRPGGPLPLRKVQAECAGTGGVDLAHVPNLRRRAGTDKGRQAAAGAGRQNGHDDDGGLSGAAPAAPAGTRATDKTGTGTK